MLRLSKYFADKKKARELCEMYWDKVGHQSILFYYADYLLKGNMCPKDEYLGYAIHLINWQKNEDYDSLYELTRCLKHGIGCEKNQELVEHYYKIMEK